MAAQNTSAEGVSARASHIWPSFSRLHGKLAEIPRTNPKEPTGEDNEKAMTQPMNFLVISALGRDRPGLVDRFSGALLDCGGNIVDSRMTVLGGEFAVLLLIEGPWNALAKIENALPELEQELEMTIIAKRTVRRATDRKLLPYAVEVVALDHPGIVKQLASFFSERNINIEDLSTTTYSAPHTGTPMFSVQMTVGIPADIHLGSLRDEFTDYCDTLNLDAILEPIKG